MTIIRFILAGMETLYILHVLPYAGANLGSMKIGYLGPSP